MLWALSMQQQSEFGPNAIEKRNPSQKKKFVREHLLIGFFFSIQKSEATANSHLS